MDDDTKTVKESTVQSGDITEKTTEVTDTKDTAQYTRNMLERVVWYIAGLLEALLATRFILSLLGANLGNGFASFIYDTSRVFVSPFFSLFNYNDVINGVSRFELYTIVAMIVYGLVALGIARLVTISSK